MTVGPLVPWCALRVAHAYFADGVAAPLALRPAPDTVRRMAWLSLCGTATPGSYRLYTRAGAPSPGLAGEPLMFLLDCNDSWFLNYTDLDQLQPGQTVFYADNLDAADRFAPLPDAAALPLRPRRFSWTPPAAFAGGAVRVLDRRDRLAWQAPSPAPPGRAVGVVLDGLPDGAYTLAADGLPAVPFLLYSGATRPWGVLALFAPTDAACTWSMAPRRTVWRYLVSSARLDLHGWQVQGRMADGGMCGFAAQAPDADSPYWRFTSEGPIALQERPAGRVFTLAKAGQRDGIGLPYARGDVLAAGAPGVSDIYVYC